MGKLLSKPSPEKDQGDDITLIKPQNNNKIANTNTNTTDKQIDSTNIEDVTKEMKKTGDDDEMCISPKTQKTKSENNQLIRGLIRRMSGKSKRSKKYKVKKNEDPNGGKESSESPLSNKSKTLDSSSCTGNSNNSNNINKGQNHDLQNNDELRNIKGIDELNSNDHLKILTIDDKETNNNNSDINNKKLQPNEIETDRLEKSSKMDTSYTNSNNIKTKGTPSQPSKSHLSINQHLFSDSNTVESMSINDKNSLVISLNTDNASILTLNSGKINGQVIGESPRQSISNITNQTTQTTNNNNINEVTIPAASSKAILAKSPIAIENNFEKAVNQSVDGSLKFEEKEVIMNEMDTSKSSNNAQPSSSPKTQTIVTRTQEIGTVKIIKSTSLLTSFDEGTQVNGGGDRILDGSYYKTLLTSITEEIKQNIKFADEFLLDEKLKLPDEVVGLINSFSGAANLLIKSKFKQFLGLCDDNLKCIQKNANNLNESSLNESTASSMSAGTANSGGSGSGSQSHIAGVSADDLTGFFELISIQISQMKDKYETILKWRDNNWEEPALAIPEKKMNISSYSTPCIQIKGQGQDKGVKGNTSKTEINTTLNGSNISATSTRPASAQSSKSTKSEIRGKVGVGVGASGSNSSTPVVSKRAAKSKQASSALREQIKAARKAKMLQERKESEDIIVS